MPGDRKKPIDGTIIVEIGELQAEGKLAGLTIAQARELILKNLPDPAAMPSDAVVRITTMDPEDETWKKIAGPQEEALVMRTADWGLQIFQGVSKTVPDDYVIRTMDVHLSFKAPEAPTPP
ncbi:MAG TPA: hypothetical protein VL500_07260 [Candidatus Eisenbacteria bacterium]|jgi:hypothetical protein|nr:hypothetical protein [Candidatus Eisenbacteria bacterium]